MESVVEVPPKKEKGQQNLNLPVSECVRQFELRRQFPSTVNELRTPGTEKSTTIQTKSVQNIISALPLSAKMKFIPNKELALSENLQKLKLKLPDGKDVCEVKLVSGNEKKTSHTISMTKIGTKSDNPLTWTIKSLEESQKSKLKTTTKIISSLSSTEESSKVLQEKISPKRMKIQLLNDNQVSTINSTSNKSKIRLTNIKKVLTSDEHEPNKHKFVIHGANSDIIQKLVLENPNILKNLSKSQKVIVMQKDKNQVFKSGSEKVVTLKPVSSLNLNNHNLKKNMEAIVYKSSLNGSIIKKRLNSCSEQLHVHEHKKRRLENLETNLNLYEDNKRNSEKSRDSNEIISIKQVTNVLPRKNVMVIVPNETAEELTASNFSSVNIEKSVQKDKEDVIIIENNKVTKEIVQDTEFNNDSTDDTEDLISNLSHQKKQSSNVNEINNLCEQNSDKFSILRKAVLSCQDAKLRADALKALKDCGIKVKKKIPLKRTIATKMINESGTQTEVFSLLKNDEFLLVSEDSEDLIKLKQKRILMKQPINSLSFNRSANKIYSEENHSEYQNKLDNMLQNMFPNNKGILDVKEAFAQNKLIYVKTLLEQLKEDFKAAKNYDEDGLLGIHKAVMNNDLREVQKHILILKAARQSIDICSLDEKTSLELAVEFDVDPQIVKVLLDAGALPVSSKPVHDSAIILAAKTSSKILTLLLQYVGTNCSLLNAKDSNGFAAIHHCAQLGNLKGIKDLLEFGVDVNLQDDKSGRTALFYALDTRNNDIPQETYYGIAHELIEHGAVSNIQTFSKHNALSLIDDIKSHALKIAINRAVK